MKTIFVLEGERAPTANQMNCHWTKRAPEVKQIHATVQKAFTGREVMYKVPVDIEIIAMYIKRPIDSDNIWSKPYIDALKGTVIKNDNPNWVRRVIKESCWADRNAVIITIYPSHSSSR
jgi:hypothetical protein